MWAPSLGQEDPLEKEMATHSSVLAWEIPWTEEPGGLQPMGSQRVRHNWLSKQQQWSITKCRGRPGRVFHSLLSVVNSTWLQPLKHMGPPSGRGRWTVGSPRLNSTEHARSHIVDGSKRWLSIACSFWVFSRLIESKFDPTYHPRLWKIEENT